MLEKEQLSVQKTKLDQLYHENDNKIYSELCLNIVNRVYIVEIYHSQKVYYIMKTKNSK